MGTSTAKVTTNAQTISSKPATARANAVDLFGRSANNISVDSRDSGIKMLIGKPRLRIAVCPISRKVHNRMKKYRFEQKKEND
jgi:hypothetical protein